MIEDEKKVGTSLAEQIANDIVSVQPMPNNIIKNLYDNSMSEEQLKKEGYSPLSNLNLVWVKVKSYE